MVKIIKYLDQWSPIWSDIRKLGGNKIIRSSMMWMFIVPMLAKIIVPLNEIQLSLGAEVIRVSLSLLFSWKYLYFAALFFGIASALYSVWCPRVIKAYTSYTELEELGKGSRTIIDSLNAATKLEKAYNTKAHRTDVLWQFITDYMIDVKTTKTTLPDLAQLSQDLFNGKIQPEYLREAFWFTVNFCEELSPVKRFIVSALYFAGFSCLGIIVVVNTYKVTLVAF